MEFIGTYTKLDLSDRSVVAHGQQLPRPVWGAEAWLDPGNNISNCPAEYVGFGWWPEFSDVPTLPESSYYGEPVWQEPDTVNVRVVRATPVVAKSEASLYAEQVSRLNAMRAQVKVIFDEKVAEGCEAAPGVRVGLHGDAFVTLDHAEKALTGGESPFYARTSMGDQLYVSEASAVAALITAMREKYLSYVKRENAIQDELDAAAQISGSSALSSALDAIDITSGWTV